MALSPFFNFISLNFLKNFFLMRYLSIFLPALLFVGFFVSCNVTASVDIFDEAVLHATYVGGKATKTTFGRTTTAQTYSEIYWEKGDAINLFYLDGNSAVACAQYEAEQAGISSDFAPAQGGDPVDPAVVKASTQFIGFYPYNADATADFSNSTITTSIPSDQQAIDDLFDPKALLAVGSSASLDNMSFYNICGGICFTLENPGDYSAIKFSGKKSESVAGTISVSVDSPSEPSAVATGDPVTTVTLTPSDQFNSGKVYYISILPGFFSEGFTMTFVKKDQSSFDCTCSASVTFRRGVFGRVDNVDNPAKLASIRDGQWLSTDTATANCYVVSAPGTYIFPLVRGINPASTLADVTSVEVLWETDNTATAPAVGSIISKVSINRGAVYFDIPNPIHNGNALIAAKSGNEILWSWHIWVCEGYDPGASSQRLYSKPNKMLDRNLGALSASYSSLLTNGLFYQWGRKDPFPGAVEKQIPDGNNGSFFATTAGAFPLLDTPSDVTVEFAVQHPTTYFTKTQAWLYDNTLWEDTKTDYDPCPIGWKVPRAFSYTAESGHAYSEEAWSLPDSDLSKVIRTPAGNVPYYGLLFPLAGGGEYSWYPNTGYISLSGELLMVGYYSCYWSSTPFGGHSYALELYQNMDGSLDWSPFQYGKFRNEGHAVRCIQD